MQYVVAEQAKQEAVDQRNQAQVTQSLFLADLSRQQRETDSGTAILLALEALPDTASGVTRPYVPEAELQLDHACVLYASDWFSRAIRLL